MNEIMQHLLESFYNSMSQILAFEDILINNKEFKKFDKTLTLFV